MQVILLGVLIAFLWGIQPLLQKHLLKKMSSESMFTFTVILNFIFIIGYMYYHKEKIHHDFSVMSHNDFVFLITLVFICSFVTSLLYYYLIQNHEPYLIIPIVYSAPLFTVLLSSLNGESVGNYRIIGAIISMIGLYFIMN